MIRKTFLLLVFLFPFVINISEATPVGQQKYRLIRVSRKRQFRRSRRAGPVRTAKEAKDIAETETGGIALSARRVHLNGASCGWEVVVHMPGEARGWKCIVDADAHMLFTKEFIPNPPLPMKRK